MDSDMQVSEPSAKYMVKAAEYKQTDIGLIPQDWEIKPLSQLINSVEYGSSAKSSLQGAIPVLRMGNLQDGRIDWDNLVYTSDESEISKYRLNAGDVLFNRTNTPELVGKTAIYSGEQPAIFAGYLIRIKTKATLDPVFLNYILNTEFSRKYSTQVLSIAVGQANINGKKLKTYPIPTPPTVQEQQAIATALSDTDALIDALEQLLVKKRQVKQGAMRELLTGKRRLEVFNGKWQQKTIGDLVQSLDAGVSVNATENKTPTSTEPCILKTSAAFNGRFLPEEAKPIIPQDMRRAKLSPRRDTLIISRMNTPDLIGECGYVDQDYPNLFIPDRLWMTRFRPEAEVCAQWLGYLLSTNEYKIIIKSAATGTSDSMKNLSKDALLSIQINAPSKIEQTAIAAILSDMDTDITDLETRLGKVRQVKQGMMRELLTGRTRLA